MSISGTTNAYGKDMWLRDAVDALERSPGNLYGDLTPQEPIRVEGRNAYFKVRISDQLGFGIVPENGALGRGNDMVYLEGRLTMARLRETIEMSFDEFEMFASYEAGAIPLVTDKMTTAVSTMQRQLSRIIWSDGSARLGRCAASAATTVVNLQVLNGDPGFTAGNQIDRDRFNWLDGQRARIDIVDATTGVPIANGSNRTVIAADLVNNTITLDTTGGNVTTTTSHIIVWAGSVVNGTGASREFAGMLAAIADTGTYLGIDRAIAGNSTWKSYVVNGATTGTNELFTTNSWFKLLNRMARQHPMGQQPTPDSHTAYSNFGCQAAVVQQLIQGIRYTDNGTPDVGWRVAELLGIKWKSDHHAPHNNIFLIDPRKAGLVKPKNQRFAMLNFLPGAIDGMWNLANSATAGQHDATYIAYMTGLCGLAVTEPMRMGRLNDMTELGV